LDRKCKKIQNTKNQKSQEKNVLSLDDLFDTNVETSEYQFNDLYGKTINQSEYCNIPVVTHNFTAS